MPPPAPTKPQIKPIMMPHPADFISRSLGETASMLSLVVMTGRTMNFTPSSMVMQTEKLPMVAFCRKLAA